jgi:hypothetical protein
MTTRIRVTPAFVRKFDEALRRLEDHSGEIREVRCNLCDQLWRTGSDGNCAHCKDRDAFSYVQRTSRPVPRQIAVEEFLEDIMDDIVAAVLMGRTDSSTFHGPGIHFMLDKESPGT